MNRFNVFFDHNCPPQLARTLDGFLSTERPRPRVVLLRDVLPMNTNDEDWLPWIGRQDGEWIVVSNDGAMLRNSAERRAFEAHVGRLVLAPKAYLKRPGNERSALLVWHWPAIVQTMSNLDPTVVLDLPAKRSGRPTVSRTWRKG